MTFNLADIRQTMRNVTGSPNTLQTPDSLLDDYINKYYRFFMPDDIKPFKTLVDYKFNTLQNQVNYTFDLEKYVSLEPEFFVNGNRILYYQDRSLWIRDFQYQYNQSSISGTGSNPLTGSITQQLPIVPGTVIFDDSVESFFDNSDGTLTGSQGGTGTINYTSGAFSLSFNTTVALGATVYQTYAPVINGRPRAMFYDGQGTITFSPIPDQSYSIEGSAYMMPTAFLSGTNSGLQTPQIQQWGYVIAYGASLELFRQRGQLDQAMMYQPSYEKHLDIVMSRSTQQYSNQRTVPKW